MNSIQKLRKELESTLPISDLMETVREEPVALLMRLVKEYERTNRPIGDHYLDMSSFTGSASIRALIEAGLVEEHSEGRHFIKSYVPTDKAIDYVQQIRKEAT